MDSEFNITDHIFVKYPPHTNMIFPNKTLILFTKHQNSISTQQMALLTGMAFIVGIVAGLLIRCIYHGIVKYFISNVDELASSGRRDRGNTNPSFVDDSFRHANDEPPDYLTVVTDTPQNSVPQQQGDSKTSEDSKVSEEMPPAYTSVVPNASRFVRSAST